jgi:hypothetical protein
MKSWWIFRANTTSAAVSRLRSMIRCSPVTAEEAHKETAPRNAGLAHGVQLGVGVGHPDGAVDPDGHHEDANHDQRVGQAGRETH